MASRRTALRVLTGAAALPLMRRQHLHADRLPAGPVALTASEFALVGVLAEAVLPRTETPGALDVGVPLLIDEDLAGNEGLRHYYRERLALVDRAALTLHSMAFVDLDEERQFALLSEWNAQPETDLGGFFRLVKHMTIDTFYSTQQGLEGELGWQGNRVLTEFPGCDHSEHGA